MALIRPAGQGRRFVTPEPVQGRCSPRLGKVRGKTAAGHAHRPLREVVILKLLELAQPPPSDRPAGCAITLPGAHPPSEQATGSEAPDDLGIASSRF